MNNTFETERLILRPIRHDDAESIFKYRSDGIANQYQGWIPQTIVDVNDFINNRVSFVFNQPGTWFQFVVINKSVQQLIGDIGVHFIDTAGLKVELGCTLHKNFQGYGYASEALVAIINILFDGFEKQQIISTIDPRNNSSIRLFKSLGFVKLENHEHRQLINDEGLDDLVFILFKNNWIRNR